MADVPVWCQLREALWPDLAQEDLVREAHAHARGEGLLELVMLAEAETGEILGMLELSLRSYAEGCHTTPVPYVEGWYVVPQARRLGVGRALVAAAEQWASAHGHFEIASDVTIGNKTSEQAHLKLGFEEVERAIHFRKILSPATTQASPPAKRGGT
ncbi:MAG: GNAT family N-acetyltransferase [Pseudomonadota bacterium]